MLPDSMKPYAKAVVAALGAVATWLAAATSDGSIEVAEWGALPVAVLTAAGVFAIRNVSKLADGVVEVEVVEHLDPRPYDRGERGAVEPGSLALGVVLGFALALILIALGAVTIG